MHKLKKIISMLAVFCLMSGPLMASDPKATAIRTTTSSFNNNLSGSDTTVQAALDTLDNMSVSGAPTGATYITQTTNGSLSAEQALSSLATGIVKNTTATGVLSIAAAGTDYVAPAGNVATATALAANGANCSSGNAPLGVDASGAVESCFDVGTQTEVDLKAPLASPTFTGTVTLPASTALVTPAIGAATGTSLALSGALGQIGGSTGVSLSGATGVLTIASVGNTNNENLKFDAESVSNKITVSSSTSVSILAFSGFSLTEEDDMGLSFGNSADSRFEWDTAETNDTLKLGLIVGTSGSSGNFALVEKADISTNFAYPQVANPTLVIQSSDETTVADNVKIWHDQTDGNISTGTGNLKIAPAGGTVAVTGGQTITTTLTSSRTTDFGWAIVTGANTACNTTCTSACVFGWDTAVTEVAVACTDATADKCLCAGAS